MDKLTVVGEQRFLDIDIPVIEGGFGENEKCMLAKTIAEVHGVELKFINQLINSNIDEFEVGIDILDIKNSVDSVNPVLETEFTKQSVANSSNIYLLSEQGYMLLVSFMKTEKSKEIRKVMRREYFQMRAEIKNKRYSQEDIMMYQLQEQKKIKEQLSIISEKTLKNENDINSLPLLPSDSKELNKLVKTKVVILLGGKKTLAYKELKSKVFSDLYKQLHRNFDVKSTTTIKRKSLSKAEVIVDEYKLPYALEQKIIELNNQMDIAI